MTVVPYVEEEPQQGSAAAAAGLGSQGSGTPGSAGATADGDPASDEVTAGDEVRPHKYYSPCHMVSIDSIREGIKGDSVNDMADLMYAVSLERGHRHYRLHVRED